MKILRERCYVRTLSLVRVNFDAESVDELCMYLSKKPHPYVEDLDLSDNRLAPALFGKILEVLA